MVLGLTFKGKGITRRTRRRWFSQALEAIKMRGDMEFESKGCVK
jgi:hypothetical protein